MLQGVLGPPISELVSSLSNLERNKGMEGQFLFFTQSYTVVDFSSKIETDQIVLLPCLNMFHREGLQTTIACFVL